RIAGLARAFDDQPATPTHFIERLFYLRQVDFWIILQPNAVLIRAMNLADASFAERAQFLIQIAIVQKPVGKIEVALDRGRADFVEQLHLFPRVQFTLNTNDDAGLFSLSPRGFQPLDNGGAKLG